MYTIKINSSYKIKTGNIPHNLADKLSNLKEPEFMNINLKKIVGCLALILAPNLFASGMSTQTQTQMLSGVDKDNTVLWDFKLNAGRNSGEWKKIPVPSNWEMQGFGTYRYWNDWQKDPVLDTEGVYRTKFTAPVDWHNKQIEIVFGGVMTDTHVTLNGKPIGKIHQGGFYEFRYNISSAVKVGGDNLLEVKVNRFSTDESINRAERSADFWLFSGIYRPVWLEIKPLDNIDRINIDAKHTGEFSADIILNRSEKTADKVVMQLTTLDGKKIGKPATELISADQTTAHLKNKFEKIIPWSAENPQRYQIEFTLMVKNTPLHSLNKIIGFRTIELRKQDGLYVNGAKVRLKGSNRHSTWPTSGRTTSKALSYQDVRLMKEMNMNAVRMSHYPPDAHFLDVTDELGLYVIDELTGWQQAYSTKAGIPLVKELVERDQYHPSILMWANGNEGGFNFDLDNEFAKYDLQTRPVIHPWENFGGINTGHYEAYDCCANSFFHGRDVFMPTEFLHGLYDGGHGAGLADWWNAMLANPRSAGGFLWAYADEGIVRDDMNGAIDVAGNRAPDGIVGPYREKEASFFAIKKIWSPVYLPLAEQTHLPSGFDGNLQLENRYDFSNLKNVTFSWQLVKFNSLASGKTGFNIFAQGGAPSPDVAPAMRGTTQIKLPKDWDTQDALYFTAKDEDGKEIYTWSWMIANANSIAQTTLAEINSQTKTVENVSLVESKDVIELHANNVKVLINRATGYLQSLEKNNTQIPLSSGPRLVTGTGTVKNIALTRAADAVDIAIEYTGNMRKIHWRLTAAGVLSVNYAYQMEPNVLADNLGVTFDYPEAQVTGMRWLGKGPYRVWKNRTQGVEFSVWQKKYNDTVTGQSWIYPEFKGYHDKIYWAEFSTKNLPLTFINHADDIVLRVFTPREAQGVDADPKSTHVSFPAGDISFLNAIAPTGTKFDEATSHGASGQKNRVPRLGGWFENTIDIVADDLPAL